MYPRLIPPVDHSTRCSNPHCDNYRIGTPAYCRACQRMFEQDVENRVNANLGWRTDAPIVVGGQLPDCERCGKKHGGTNRIKFPVRDDGYFCDGCFDYMDALADIAAERELEQMMENENDPNTNTIS